MMSYSSQGKCEASIYLHEDAWKGDGEIGVAASSAIGSPRKECNVRLVVGGVDVLSMRCQ